MDSHSQNLRIVYKSVHGSEKRTEEVSLQRCSNIAELDLLGVQ